MSNLTNDFKLPMDSGSSVKKLDDKLIFSIDESEPIVFGIDFSLFSIKPKYLRLLRAPIDSGKVSILFPFKNKAVKEVNEPIDLKIDFKLLFLILSLFSDFNEPIDSGKVDNSLFPKYNISNEKRELMEVLKMSSLFPLKSSVFKFDKLFKDEGISFK